MLYEVAQGIHFRVLCAQEENDCIKSCSPSVLLLHGWMGCMDDLSIIAAELARLGLTVYVPDLPLHGNSIAVSAVSPSEAAQKVVSAFESLRPRSREVILCGYSMGGRLVLEMTRSWTKISKDKLILLCAICISSALPPKSPHERREQEQKENTNATIVSVLDTQPKFEQWLKSNWYSKQMWGQLKSHPSFNQLIERRVSCFTIDQLEAWVSALRDLGTSRMETAYRLSSTPLLYVYGEADEKYTAMKEAYERLSDNCHCVEITKAGHNVVFEQSDLVLSAISSFVISPPIDCHLRFGIRSVSISPYSIDLTKIILIGEQAISKREGLLVIIKLSNHQSGIGDVAPLPGWHSSTIDDVTDEINDFSKATLVTAICPLCYKSSDISSALSTVSSVTAAGIEAALIQALAKSVSCELLLYLQKLRSRYEEVATSHTEGRSEFEKLESCSKPTSIPRHLLINGVLPRSICKSTVGETNASSSLLDRDRLVDFISNTPFKTLKLKVGAADSIEEDANFVRQAVTLAIENEKSIRIDANQAWALEEWRVFRDIVDDLWASIEFIEEPLQSGKLLFNALQSGDVHETVKVALDESLTGCSSQEILSAMSNRNCAAVIIKPSMFRSISDIFRLAKDAQASNTNVIISSTFESGVGLAWLAHVAASCEIDERFALTLTCHGLGTFVYLETDVLSPTFQEFCVDQTGISLYKSERFLDLCNDNRIVDAKQVQR